MFRLFVKGARRVAWFKLLRVIGWPYRTIRGICFPRRFGDPLPEFNRIVNKAWKQGRGPHIAFDLGGYAYEVVDGLDHPLEDFLVEGRNNPNDPDARTHYGVNENPNPSLHKIDTSKFAELLLAK